MIFFHRKMKRKKKLIQRDKKTMEKGFLTKKNKSKY